MQNFSPSNLRASSSKKKLMLKYVYCTGKPVAQYTIEAIPGTPPVAVSYTHLDVYKRQVLIGMIFLYLGSKS